MIKWIVLGGAVVAGIAFAAGSYAGWKTTMKVFDVMAEKLAKENRDRERHVSERS